MLSFCFFSGVTLSSTQVDNHLTPCSLVAYVDILEVANLLATVTCIRGMKRQGQTQGFPDQKGFSYSNTSSNEKLSKACGLYNSLSPPSKKKKEQKTQDNMSTDRLPVNPR